MDGEFTCEGTRDKSGNLARNGRLGKVLEGFLHVFGNFLTGDQLHEVQRFIQARGDAAAGDAIAVVHEARKTTLHLHLWVSRREALDEGPMGGDLESVQKAGIGSDQRAFADTGDELSRRGTRPNKFRVAGICHLRQQRVWIATRNPEQVNGWDEIEGAVRRKLETIAGDDGFLLFGNEENLHPAVTPLGSHPLEYLVRDGDIHEIDAGINGNGDDEIGAHKISRFRFV
jgi:hypothetical protein